MSGAYLNHAGIVARAFFSTLRASFLEVAVIRHINGVRYVTGDIEKLVAVLIHGGLGLLQTYGLGKIRRVS